jgi:hypothetical protein
MGKARALVAATIAVAIVTLGLFPALAVHASSPTGTILKECTPFGANGRGLAFDGTFLIATYTSDNENSLTFWTVPGCGFSHSIVIHDVASGALVSCGALSWDGSKLWCGTYDGLGHVYTVDELTGLATLVFTSPSVSDTTSESCYPQPNGGIDGIAFASDTSTLYLGEDAGMKVWHTTTAGGVIGSFTAPYATISGVTYSCKAGIAFEPSTFLWMPIYSNTPTVPNCTSTDPDCSFNTGRIAQFTEAGVYTGLSFTSTSVAEGTSGQLKEGVAWDSTTFASTGDCAVWAINDSAPTTSAGLIDAYAVPCPTANHGVPEFSAGLPLLLAMALPALLLIKRKLPQR